MKLSWRLVISLLLFLQPLAFCASSNSNPKVIMQTNFGDITIELFPKEAPVTTDNFLKYTNTHFYDGLLFHRVIENFMIQGGGFFLEDLTIYQAAPDPPIINESYNNISNLRGTIAMARTADPNSATSQFFINHIDNLFLDYQDPNNVGYCVFAKVTSDMAVIDAIAQTPTIYVSSSLQNFPYNPTVDINSASVLPCWLASCSDLNYDGFVNLNDLATFASHWTQNECKSQNNFCSGTDLNYDGTTDTADMQFLLENWLTPVGLETRASDITGNDNIALDDFAVLAENWMKNDCSKQNDFCQQADIDRRSYVDYDDLTLFITSWQTLN